MTLAAPETVPPTVFAVAPARMATPLAVLPSLAVAGDVGAILLPSTTFPVAPPCRYKPAPKLPEITLASPAAVPPTVFRAPIDFHTRCPFSFATVPVTSVPM